MAPSSHGPATFGGRGLWRIIALVGAMVIAAPACNRQPAPATGKAAAGEPGRSAAGVVAAPAAAATATSPAAAPKPELKLPSGLDTADLDEDEVAMLSQILAEQFDPCGRSRSFLQSLQAGDCALATRLARFLVHGLQEGHGRRRLVGMLLREIERLNTVVQVDVKGAAHLGEPGAKVKVVEFSDFECPFCRRMATPVKRLQAHYGFALYFKHFPLTNHKLAEGAARAAWAAQQQERFWPMHDILFANVDKLTWADVQGYARKLGLDMKRFVSHVESEAARNAVQRDYDHGVEAGVDGTPTFFVNGRRAETLEQLQSSIREQLSLAGSKTLPAPLDLTSVGPADTPSSH